MEIGYFGTPEHSKELLQMLYDAGHKIAFVVTNPDRPKGRNKKLTPSPVKVYAEKKSIPIFQPERLKSSPEKEEIKKFNTDLHIVYAYGQIIPEDVFMLPKIVSMNLHGSLLPEYRGASPVQTAIMDGKKTTGFTLQKLSKELDAGDILYQETIPILDEDNTETILKQITERGGRKILELIKNNGPWIATPQNSSLATYCRKILPEDRIIHFQKDHISIHNQIRALYPEPLAYTFFKGKRILILQSNLNKSKPSTDPSLEPGSLVKEGKNLLFVTCGDQFMLSIEALQPEGKKPMKAIDFINGYQIKKGDYFSEN